jgi:hypothetical protein
VPRIFSGMLQEGIARGELRAMHPMAAYFSALAPIVFFLAADPIRQELGETHLTQLRGLTPEEFVRQIQEAVRRALAPLAPPKEAPPRKPQRKRRPRTP